MLTVRNYLCFSLIIPCIAFAQVDTAWVRRYTGPGNQNDIPKDIIVNLLKLTFKEFTESYPKE